MPRLPMPRPLDRPREPDLPRPPAPVLRALRVRLRDVATSPAAKAVLAGACWLAVGVVLFTAYLHLSRTVPANSDGASNALQAWAMMHGNPLLRGWWLSDVSFYTTELPEYMLIERVHGLGPDDIHIASALTYTLLVLLAAFVAKGRASGREGLVRAGIAAGIMAAPPQGSVYELMLEPDHLGSAVPVLLLVLLLDRAGRRWLVPVVAFVLVTWALIADPVIEITAVGPLLFVALVSGYRRLVVLRRKLATAWFELGLVAAALAGALVADRTVALIRARGGYWVSPVNNKLARFDTLPHNALVTIQGLLVLFGANFPGRTVGLITAVSLLHLVGLGLAGWAVFVALRRLWRLRISEQLLAASVCFTLLAYLLGPDALTAQSSREMAAVLPLGAALAGRMLARPVRRVALGPALAAVLAGYLVGLAFYASRPPVPADNQALAGWLASHRLTYGLTTSYWVGNSTTVDSGATVAVRTVQTNGPSVRPNEWEIRGDWYVARAHVANFVVLPRSGPGSWHQEPGAGTIEHSFGRPAQVYELPAYTVLVWHDNLLTRIA